MNPLLLLLLAGGAIAWISRRQQPQASSSSGGGYTFFSGVVDSVSNLTKPKGVRNHNPGNLRYIPTHPWDGQVGDDGGYGVYASDALGLRAMAKQIAKHMRAGKDTVRKLIGTYAPQSENPTEAYIKNVASALGLPLVGDPPETHALTLDRATLFQLMRAMLVQEQGRAWAMYYTDADIRLAVNEAFAT